MKNLAAASALLLAVPLAACGSSSNAPAPVTTTVTTKAPAPQETTSAQAPTTTSAVHTSTTSAVSGSVTNFQQYMYEQLLKNPNPGDSIDMKGTAATVCISGDGYALHLVAAGPNTSCDFAKAVVNAQTQGLNATGDNIRDSLQPSIEVTSPVTGKAYTMSCSNDADNLITCTGGDNASVFMY